MSNAFGYEEDLTPNCEECGGTGEVMEVRCYGGSPCEYTETCSFCDGEGKENKDD